jgi:hypothetical protein
MKRVIFGAVLGLALYLVPDHADAQQQSFWYDPSTVGGHRLYMATLVVDARPLDAEVLLDGRSLGAARDLIAQGLSIVPGRHLLEVRANGYRSYSAFFGGDSRDSVNRFTVRLPPQ